MEDKNEADLEKSYKNAMFFITFGCILLFFSAIMSFCGLIESIYVGEITIQLFAELLLFIFSSVFLIIGLSFRTYIKMDKCNLSLILSIYELLKITIKIKDKLVKDLSKLDNRVINLETMKKVGNKAKVNDDRE